MMLRLCNFKVHIFLSIIILFLSEILRSDTLSLKKLVRKISNVIERTDVKSKKRLILFVEFRVIIA